MVDSWLVSTAALVWVLCNLQLMVIPATLRTEGVVRIGQFFMQHQPNSSRTARGRCIHTLRSPSSPLGAVEVDSQI